MIDLIEQQESLLMEEIQEKQGIPGITVDVQQRILPHLNYRDIAAWKVRNNSKTLPDYTFNRIGGRSTSVGVDCILDFQRNGGLRYGLFGTVWLTVCNYYKHVKYIAWVPSRIKLGKKEALQSMGGARKTN